MAISDGDRHEAYLRRVEPPALDAKDILAMLRRRATFIAGVTLACAAMSLAYVLLAAPKYVASGRILLNSADSRIAGTDAASHSAADTSAIEVENQIKTMTSLSVLNKVIAREKLEFDPLFGAKSKGILPALLIGIGVVPAADPHATALRQLERAVSATRNPGSFAVDVNVVTPDRETSARVANAVMDTYVEDAARVGPEATPRTGAPTDISLEALQARLRDAEQSYQKYRQDNGIAGTSGQSAIEKQVSELSGQIAAAEAKVNGLRATLTQVQRAEDDRDFNAIAGALRSRTVETLKNRYIAARRIEADLSETFGPRHPDLRLARRELAEAKRLLDQAIGDMVQSITAEQERTRSTVTRLKSRLEALKKDMVRSNETSTRLRELERDVETNRAAYQAFLQRPHDLGEQQKPDGLSPRILSRATPSLERGGASTARVLLISILLGLGLAISLAWLLELSGERKERAAFR
ncbi:MAG: GumC family protein [Afipia sp.]